MKIQTNISKLRGFAAGVKAVREQYPKAEKLLAAIDNIAPEINEQLLLFDKQVKKLQLKHANTDANGSLLYLPDKSAFAYTKDAYVLVNEEIDALVEQGVYEYEPLYIDELPKDFNSQLIPLLEGFIIKPKK